MKTRTKKSAPTSKKADETKPTIQTLDPSVASPPQVFILPKQTSTGTRIVTLPHPATSQPSRYLICPERGCFEFTSVAGPKKACRSWLLAPDHGDVDLTDKSTRAEEQGYLLQTPELMIATPVDPLFLLLPALSQDSAQSREKQLYLTLPDYLDREQATSPHFAELMRTDASSRLERLFDGRIRVICDVMQAGDETLFRLSNEKLLAVLVEKAKKVVARGLPASLEERFVKQALAVPVLSVRREESGVSLADREEVEAGAEADSQSASTSQETSQASNDSTSTTASVSTAATSVSTTPPPPPVHEDVAIPTEEITHLLRLRTALNFLLTSYVPSSLRLQLTTALSLPTSPIDFIPLDKHLEHLASLKKEAQALRSLSENISRKRGLDDDEAEEMKAEKKRKKEEEEMKKKNVSRGVKQLGKVDTKGMMKLSSFFSKPAAKKGQRWPVAATTMNCIRIPASKASKSYRNDALPSRPLAGDGNKVYAVVEYEDDYVQPLLLAALKARLPPELLVFINSTAEIPPATKEARVLQWLPYERIDFDGLVENPTMYLANSYVIRKALIRKHFLAKTVEHWITKHPKSVLKDHVKPAIEFEVDYAEFLDDALVEAWELKESWARNAELPAEKREWWILKPGMSDRGQGIRLFSSEDGLKAIFEEWDPPDDEDEAEDQSALADGEETKGISNGIMTSQLRHFIAQPYIDPPLLLPSPHPSAGRKFHIRTYVLAIGALKVYVYKSMLALFAAHPYLPPSDSANDDLARHLTNTCLQDTDEREGSVEAFWSLPLLDSAEKDKDWRAEVFTQICKTTAELFEAAARSMSIHFQPLPNAFEVFGVDFMVDAQGTAWLLEVNAFPDFKQTGDELSGTVRGLMESVVDTAVKPFFGLEREGSGENKDMIPVLNIDLGRR